MTDTTTTTDPEALAYARAIDTEVADLWDRAARLGAHADKLVGYLRNARAWDVERYTVRQAEVLAELAEVQARLDVLDRIYQAHQWSRFYLVRNTNGHIHRTMSCHTTFPTTSWGWLPQLSGLTEAEAVADQGEILCSICYPSAPVAWCSGRSKADQAAAAERAAAKAERAAKKAAKALYADDPDREYICQGTYPNRLQTIAAAKSWLTNGWGWGWDQHPNYRGVDRDAVAALLAERLGSTPADEIEAARVRQAKRAARR